MLYRSNVVPSVDKVANTLAQEIELLLDEAKSTSAAGSRSKGILLGVDGSNCEKGRAGAILSRRAAIVGLALAGEAENFESVLSQRLLGKER